MKVIASVALLVFALGGIAANSRLSAIARETQRQADKNMTNPDDSLEVSVITDKPVYKLNDRIKLQALLTNTSRNTLYIYGVLGWGYSASFTLHVTNARGEGIQAKRFDDSITPPPPPNDMRAFVRLYPQHFLGTWYHSSIDELNLGKPGKYALVVEYRSPLSATGIELNPFWGREKGTIRSKLIYIEVIN